MKKYLLYLFVILIPLNYSYADKLLKSGFLSGEWDLDTNFNLDNPNDKIIIIFNHGSAENDKPSKDCVWKNNIRNFASLSGNKIKDKEVLVYLLCTDDLGGDNWKIFWKNKDVKYKGTPKLEKRVSANVDLIEKFISLGVPNNQIFMAGQSCGGWATMMLISRYPNNSGSEFSVSSISSDITWSIKLSNTGVSLNSSLKLIKLLSLANIIFSSFEISMPLKIAASLS